MYVFLITSDIEARLKCKGTHKYVFALVAILTDYRDINWAFRAILWCTIIRSFMAGRSFPNGQLLPMRNGFITSLFIPWYGGSCLRTSKFEWLSRTDCTIRRRWHNDGRTWKSEVTKHYWARSVVFLKRSLSRHFRGTPVGLKMLQNQ